MTTTKQKLDVQVRWLIRRDLGDVCDIENNNKMQPWKYNDFLEHLRRRNSIGMVAENGTTIAGFMIYELGKRSINIVNFGVAPDCTRLGVGTAMIEKLVSKLCQERRRSLRIIVEDDNLDMHLFLRAMGFQAVRVVRSMPRDEYVFRYDSEV